MVDVMDAGKRSALMSRIRGKNTAPELHVRRGLWRAGFRYRLHSIGLKGKPDIVLRRWNAAVFVHGCFWHHHDQCKLAKLPSTRSGFWSEKLLGNRTRDERAVQMLRSQGWRVAVVWECAIRAAPEKTIRSLVTWVRSSHAELELRDEATP